jgi:hypothetical protein
MSDSLPKSKFLLFLVRCNDVEVNLRPTVSRPVCLGIRHPPGARDQFFFVLEISFRQLRVCYFVAPSLTRGLVCNLLYNYFWAFARAVTLGSKSRKTRRSHITTDSQSASQSWCHAPIRGPRPIFLLLDIIFRQFAYPSLTRGRVDSWSPLYSLATNHTENTASNS